MIFDGNPFLQGEGGRDVKNIELSYQKVKLAFQTFPGSIAIAVP